MTDMNYRMGQSMRLARINTLAGITLYAISCSALALQDEPQYCSWKAQDFAISAPLCGLVGDPVRGRALAVDTHAGNCLACHQMPIPEHQFHGTVGPPLFAIGARYNKGQIRLRIVDEQQINPMTIMPGFYRHPETSNRIADDFWGRTMLSAQQVEDLVAYLVTLK